MNEQAHTDEHWHGACGAGIFHAMFRLVAVSDLYGPARAVEWAQSLVDDPDLLSAFAHTSGRPTAPSASLSQDRARPAAGPAR